MKMRMYSVFDKAISAFTPPFCCRTDGEAKRSFAQEAVNANAQIGKHKSDYSLFFIGYFDDALGACSAAEGGPICIAEALSIGAEFEEQ